MIQYFKKAYPNQPVILSSGKGILFQSAPSGKGLLAVDPAKRPDLIRDFESLISRKRGGFVEVTQAEFEAEKKKPTPTSPFGMSDVYSRTQLAQIKVAADRASAEAADSERKRSMRQLTPTISRSFKRPGMKFAGATENPEAGQEPGLWRPGIADR